MASNWTTSVLPVYSEAIVLDAIEGLSKESWAPHELHEAVEKCCMAFGGDITRIQEHFLANSLLMPFTLEVPNIILSPEQSEEFEINLMKFLQIAHSQHAPKEVLDVLQMRLSERVKAQEVAKMELDAKKNFNVTVRKFKSVFDKIVSGVVGIRVQGLETLKRLVKRSASTAADADATTATEQKGLAEVDDESNGEEAALLAKGAAQEVEIMNEVEHIFAASMPGVHDVANLREAQDELTLLQQTVEENSRDQSKLLGPTCAINALKYGDEVAALKGFPKALQSFYDLAEKEQNEQKRFLGLLTVSFLVHAASITSTPSMT